jgi:hypothetical protein
MIEIEERAKKRNSNLETINSAPAGDGENGVEVSEKSTASSPAEDADMEGLTGAMSSLKFVPPSVRFGRGRGRGRGGFSRT